MKTLQASRSGARSNQNLASHVDVYLRRSLSRQPSGYRSPSRSSRYRSSKRLSHHRSLSRSSTNFSTKSRSRNFKDKQNTSHPSSRRHFRPRAHNNTNKQLSSKSQLRFKRTIHLIHVTTTICLPNSIQQQSYRQPYSSLQPPFQLIHN